MRVATYNAPHRLDPHRLAGDVQKLADKGCKVICTQENADGDPAILCPSGWEYYRPAKAQSAAIFWAPATFVKRDGGAWQLHSSGWDTPRYVVWVDLEHKETGAVRRWGSAHLLSDKDGSNARANEFRHQAQRVADWLEAGGDLVGGDFNANPDSDWMGAVKEVARHHSPQCGTGPDGQNIDHWWRRKGDGEPPSSAASMAGVSDHDALLATVPGV